MELSTDLRSLFKLRKARKGVLTRIRNELDVLLNSKVSDETTHQVNNLEERFDEAFAKFKDIHDEIQKHLVAPFAIEKSFKYFDEKFIDYNECKQRINAWKADVLVNPEDSVSNAASRSSSKLSASANRARNAAKRAALQIEAASLSKKYELAEEKLRIQRREEQLKLEIELKKTRARENIYERLEYNQETNYETMLEEHQEDSVPHSHVPKPSPKPVSPAGSSEFDQSDESDEEELYSPRIRDEKPLYRNEKPLFRDEKPLFRDEKPLFRDEKPLLRPQSRRSVSESRYRDLDVLESLQKQVESQLKAQRLPKLDLPHFDGNPLNYYSFIKSFENNVEKSTEDSSQRLQLLIQYCSGKAKDIVKGCIMLSSKDGYQAAKRLLEKRFGDKYVITDAWIKKIANGPPISSNDRESLQDLADDLENCIIVLEVAGRLSEISTDEKLVKIVQRLPSYLRSRWQAKARDIRDNDEVPNINHLKQFVARAARERNDPVFGSVLDSGVSKDKNQSKRTTASSSKGHVFATQVDVKESPVNTTSTGQRWKCFYFQGDHRLTDCKDYGAISSQDKLQFVRSKKLCENCLSSTHFAGGCKWPNACKVQDCTFSRKHLGVLHEALLTLRQDKHVKQQASGSKDDKQGFVGLADKKTHREESKIKALPIVPVKVKGKDSRRIVKAYALLDTDATASWCSSSLLRQLEVHGRNDRVSLTTLGRKNFQFSTQRVSLEVMDLEENIMLELSNIHTTSHLNVSSDNIPIQQDVDCWPHLQGIKLPHIQAKVELLIGQDFHTALEPLEVKGSKDGGPYATRTCLGWTLDGPLGRQTSSRRQGTFYCNHNEVLHEQFNRFINLEFADSIACTKTAMSQDDERVLEVYDNSACMVDGHYQIAIPWRSKSPGLPNNKPLAEHRLRLLNKRLLKDDTLLKKYSEFMDGLVEKSYARKVPQDLLSRDDGKVWYLPHHSVTHPQKPEKVRVVLDCAAKYHGVSLNATVLQGPDLTSQLIGVLTKFREESCCLLADIESMYYQVKVNTDDIDALRFLWYPNNDLSQVPVEYQMLVHPFGGVWSASCANYALLRTSKDNAEDYDAQAVEAVKRNFYVDDCLKSVKSEEEAIVFVKGISSLLARGGFRLTKWFSNSRRVINSVPEQERAAGLRNLDVSQNDLPIERALGVRWNAETDKFVIAVKPKDRTATRRGILSIVSSVYDPLGFVCPFILSSKSILRDLCTLGWDEVIPDRQLARWNEWMCDLPKLEEFSLNRCFKPPDFGKVVHSRLHHFSDASEVGYGAVSYMRQENENGDIYCAFVLGKSRIAPTKQLSIPRLELSAATVSVRLDQMLTKEINVNLESSMFWTDSTAVLGYIDNKDARYQVFVANRLSIIHDGSRPEQWLHVDTKSNPADVASRGSSVDKLLHNKQWFSGPDFLWTPENTWPPQPDVKRRLSVDDPEVKREAVFHSDVQQPVLDRLFCQFSSWIKLKKSVAWILRYKQWLAYKVKLQVLPCNPPVKGRLTVDELISAEHNLLSCAQRLSFTDEMQAIDTGKGVKKASSLYKLDPVIVDGLLRVGGRMSNAQMDSNAKHPVILPKKHPVVDLIIRHFHIVAGHSGQEHVLSLVREHFWIVRARVSVRRVLRDCVDCKKRQQRPSQQKMADLPSDRVTPDKPPFSFTGVDCFGPFQVKRGRSHVKRYGVIFTCLAIRAVHIEVAHSLDTASFINSLRRFVSRRGVPYQMRSDNGGNFKAGEREVREAIDNWNKDQIHSWMLQRNIHWVFNPPSASHMGGVWERCIRTVRKVMAALLKEQILDDEGLCTLTCEVEAIVNGRPLTKVSDDPRDFEPLTPNHLLLLRKGPSLPPGHFHDGSLRRWRHVQYMADVFWRRWTKEYLPSLQQRNKWQRPWKNAKVNDLVIVVDETSPRSAWPMARIVEVFPGKDGKVRQVKVKTSKNALLRRPIQKLCLLEQG